MSYVDEVLERVVAKNPAEPEFHQAVKEVLERCDIPYVIRKDMLNGLWFKYMCNVGENLTCALLGIPFGAYVKSKEASAIRVEAMEEVRAVAKAKGMKVIGLTGEGGGKLANLSDVVIKVPEKETFKIQELH